MGMTFDQQSVRRIVETVLRSEGRIRNVNGRQRNNRTPQRPDTQWVRCQNDSGEIVPAYAVMIVTSWDFDDEGLLLTVDQQGATFQRQHVVNSADDIEIGGFGWCAVSGHVRVLYDDAVDTPDTGQTWGPKNGEWHIILDWPGFEIIGGLKVSPDVNAIMAPPVALIGKLDGALAVGGTQTVSIWADHDGSEVDTTFNVTARDWMLQTGESVASGKKVALSWINGAWYVTAAECPT